jgi:hypothetical protein
MRVEVGTSSSSSGRAPAALGIRRRGVDQLGLDLGRRRLDRFEIGVLAAFGVVSLWVLALDLWQVVMNGRVWTGTDGVYIVDQMQYLAWIRSASHHLLASNLFVLRATPADYFQPAVVISGGLSALGLAPSVSLLLWKPVAVGATFFAFREYAYRTLAGVWARRIALLLALFFGSFTIVYGKFGVLGDLFPGFLSWGYDFGLLALACMVASLLTYDHARGRGGVAWWPGLLGALASMLHPWHGELLILIVLGTELALWHGRPRTLEQVKLPLLTVVLTALPLLYYLLLGRADVSWRLAQGAGMHSFSFVSILLAIAPLLLPAMIVFRRSPASFLAVATRAWPLAALAVFIVSAAGFSAAPLHAFQGITLPLAVLAVQGVQRVGWRRLPYGRWAIALSVVAFTIPSTAYELGNARRLAAPTPDNANFIQRDERSALDFLADDRDRGGVLTRSYLGAAVPEKTGRRTLVGDCLWSQPYCFQRVNLAQALFDGTLPPSAARTFVQQTGAAFVLADCTASADLTKTLGPLIVSVHRFGCATVYELVQPGGAEGPLEESRQDAAVRATGRR